MSEQRAATKGRVLMILIPIPDGREPGGSRSLSVYYLRKVRLKFLFPFLLVFLFG